MFVQEDGIGGGPATNGGRLRLAALAVGVLGAIARQAFLSSAGNGGDGDGGAGGGAVSRAQVRGWARRRARQQLNMQWGLVTERRLTEEEMGPLEDAGSEMEDSEAGSDGKGGKAPPKRCRNCRQRLPCEEDKANLRKKRIALAAKLVLEAVALAFAALALEWPIIALLAAVQVLLLADLFRLNGEAAELGRELEKDDKKSRAKGGPIGHWDRRIVGTWEKVDELSDSQDAAADLLQLGGLPRKAVFLFKGMNIEVDGQNLVMTVITKMPFLKVSNETYPLDGSVCGHKRRDLRAGKFIGYVKIQPSGGLDLMYRWNEPLAGNGVDEIRIDKPNELHITTHLTVGDKTASYRVVYTRSNN